MYHMIFYSNPIKYTFTAELYNKNFELTIYDVTFNVIDSLGQSYTYQFNTMKIRILSIELPEGQYSFIV